MKLTPIFTAVLVILSLQAYRPTQAQAGEYEISLFRQTISQVRALHAQYRAARDAWEEKRALESETQAELYAESVIQSPQAFSRFTAAQLQNLNLEFKNSYQMAASGSLEEKAFRLARDLSDRAFGAQLDAEVVDQLQTTPDYQSAINLCQSLASQYTAAPAGSTQENVYRKYRATCFSYVDQRFEQYLSTEATDFRQSEALLLYFEAQYDAAPAGTELESFYRRNRQPLEIRTLSLFEAQSSLMNYQQLYGVQAEYSNKLQSARSNSSSELLYRSIRDSARARLDSQPNPHYPNPGFPAQGPRAGSSPSRSDAYAPTRGNPGGLTRGNAQRQLNCEIRLDPNANQQVIYRVLTRSGTLVGSYYSQQEAIQFAQNDLRCR